MKDINTDEGLPIKYHKQQRHVNLKMPIALIRSWKCPEWTRLGIQNCANIMFKCGRLANSDCRIYSPSI